MFALTVGFDRTSVHFREVFDYGKPESQPPESPTRTAVNLSEAVKNMRYLLGADTLTVVAQP
jgi:hypothetical protein